MTDITGPRALVIDDERHVRALLCELLQMWGCAAEPASSGSAGLALFEAGDYDLVVTDFAMPGLNGLRVIEDVRRQDGDVPVFMLTAATADFSGVARRLAFTLLQKPLQIGELERAVRRALAGASTAHDRQ